MKLSNIAAAGVAAGLLAAAVAGAAPAGADPGSDVNDFLTTLDGLGLGNLRPGDAAEISRTLCPRLAESGQEAADIARQVSDRVGRPIGPAALFTGTAISFLCPQAVERVAGPESITAQILGSLGI